MADYYVANDTKQLINTFDGGDYYPETSLDLLKKPEQIGRSSFKNFALTGTWSIHVFLGALPASPADWLLSANRVGAVTMLSSRSGRNCANYIAQAEEGILVTGSVPLNEALEEGWVDVGDAAAVVPYLKDNLSWGVAKDTQNVPITDEFDLTVGVSKQSVSVSGALGELLIWGHCEVLPEATAGKAGGLSEQTREKLNL